MIFQDANLFMSPFSVATTLTMCCAGAKNETRDQLKQLLCLENLSDEEILNLNKSYANNLKNLLVSEELSLKTANKLYPNQDFEINKNYIATIEEYFQSEIEKLNFENQNESANSINEWVLNQTDNKIKNIVLPSDIDSQTKLILVNAIYFRAKWNLEFSEELTRTDDFYVDDENTQTVEMMGVQRKRFRILTNPSGLKASVCELPYKLHTLSFVVILPDKGVKLEEIEEKLDANLINELLIDDHKTKLANVYMPRFKFENKTEVLEFDFLIKYFILNVKKINF